MGNYSIVGGGGLPTTPNPLNTSSQDTQHSCKETSPPLLHTTHNNTQQHTTTLQHYTTAPGYIKLPMYLLFLWRLYLMVLRAFFGPNGTLFARAISGPKSRDFQGPPLSMPLVMMLHAYRAIKTTGYINSYYFILLL
jgi:hypothetical protein